MSLEHIDLDQIQDVAQAKRAIVGLLNLVEDLQATVRELQGEVQRLRDENNRLKGEQGKPNIKPNKPGKGQAKGAITPRKPSGVSRKHGTRGANWIRSRIDREEVLTVDPTQLPADAEFKGYEDTLVQDVVTAANNVLYHKEKF